MEVKQVARLPQGRGGEYLERGTGYNKAGLFPNLLLFGCSEAIFPFPFPQLPVFVLWQSLQPLDYPTHWLLRPRLWTCKCVMVNFTCQCGWPKCPDIWSNIILGVSVRVFLNEINIWIPVTFALPSVGGPLSII